MPSSTPSPASRRPASPWLDAVRRRVAPVAACTAIAVIGSTATLAVTASSQAAPAVSSAAAPLPAFEAGSASGVLDLTAVAAAGLSAGDISLADAVGTTGTALDPRSSASATNLDGTLLTAVPLNQLASASQTAPEDNPDGAADDIIPFTTSPVLNLGVSNATASARWGGDDACLPGDVPLTRSKVTTADAEVLPVAGIADFVTIPDTVSVTETTSLIETPSADARSVQATAQGSTVDLHLLGAINVKVLSTPTLTATASGSAGGAEVTYVDPVLEIDVAGSGGTLNASDLPLDLAVPGNPLLELELRLGEVDNHVESADGTEASAIAAVLEARLVLLPAGLTVVDLDLFPMSVSAKAPVGGVTCIVDPTPSPTPSPTGTPTPTPTPTATPTPTPTPTPVTRTVGVAISAKGSREAYLKAKARVKGSTVAPSGTMRANVVRKKNGTSTRIARLTSAVDRKGIAQFNLENLRKGKHTVMFRFTSDQGFKNSKNGAKFRVRGKRP